MENPFIVTGYIKPEYFCDREQEAKRVIDCMTSGENMVIMSPRRLGKSKLIDFCLDKEEIKSSTIPITVDILRTSSAHEFAYVLGKAVFDQAARRGEKAIKSVVNTLKSINGNFGYDPLTNMPTFSLSLGDIANPLYTLEEIFSCLEGAEKRCLVAIDEFQQICYYPEKNMEAILRTHIQRCSNASFIFSGSERHLITAMFTEKAHPFYHSADLMNLEVIPLDKYIAFADRLFSQFHKAIQPDAIQLAYETFGGNTYYIQKICHELFNLLDPQACGTTVDVQQIIHRMVLDANHRFGETLSRLTLPQKELLYAIAHEGNASQITSMKFIKKHNLRSSSSVQTSMKKLTDYHLVTSGNARYYIDDPLMRLWLIRD